MMAYDIKRLTKDQLIKFFRDYRAAFPDWSVEHDVILCRAVGPVRQVIAFEALGSGAYRPWHSIETEGVPNGGQLLPQFLDVRHRQVLPREHSSKWPLVVKAMEDQFLPPVREPLGPARVLQLAEESVARNGDGSAVALLSLAVLSSHMDKPDHALAWCDRTSAKLSNLGRKLADWESRLAVFNDGLRESIQSDRAREFLRNTTAFPQARP